MQKVTSNEPAMWGPSIVGFDRYHYTYESGRQGDTLIVGFSPRVAANVLYGTISFDGAEALLDKLGKHTTGKGCLYIKRLADVDMKVLETLVEKAVAATRALRKTNIASSLCALGGLLAIRKLHGSVPTSGISVLIRSQRAHWRFGTHDFRPECKDLAGIGVQRFCNVGAIFFLPSQVPSPRQGLQHHRGHRGDPNWHNIHKNFSQTTIK
jgi:hypothetical protein